MLNPTQPQAQPQQAPVQALQGMPQAGPNSATEAAARKQGQSETSNGQYDPSVAKGLEQHLNSLPDVQKGFLNHFMTPEVVTVLGIVGGAEVYDYLKQYADPSKECVVVPRSSQPGGQQALQADQAASNSKTPPQQGGSQNAAQAPASQAPQGPQIAPTQS